MSSAAAITSHPDPINLAMGEPAEGLPPFLVEAGAAALQGGFTRYGAPGGLAELREALAIEQTGRDGLQRTMDEVIVTAGAKPALLDSLRLLVQPGEEVIVLAPYWPTFVDQILLLGACPVVVEPGPDGLPTSDAIERAVTPRSRVILVNSPSNPSGAVYSRELLASIGEIAESRDLWLLSDHAYLDLAFEDRPATILSAAPHLRDQTILVESFSKRFSMTGLRLGAALGPRAAIDSLVSLASTATTHPSSLVQHIGLAAMRLGGPWIQAQRENYIRRHKLALDALGSIPGIEVTPAGAGMFLFPDVRCLLQRHGLEDSQLTHLFLEKAGLRILPGSVFGRPGFLRISLGLEDARLDEAMQRLIRILTVDLARK